MVQALDSEEDRSIESQQRPAKLGEEIGDRPNQAGVF